MKYICYYRVLTKAQGRSGLWLWDHQPIVYHYLREEYKIVAEIIEVESGRKSDRPKPQEAIRICQKLEAKL